MTAKKNVSGKSPARTRMIEVMTMKGLAQRTQVNYLASICSLARHWGRAPQALSADEVRSGSSCGNVARLAQAARHDRNAGRNTADIAVPGPHRHPSCLPHRTP